MTYVRVSYLILNDILKMPASFKSNKQLQP